jgi:hypothetical protein
MSLTLLHCDETLLDVTEPRLEIETYLQVKSRVDRVLLEDERVRRNMLLEEKKVKKIDYCASFQTELKPHMRKIVVDWMLEVCQDQQCQPQVFHLSLNYMDRFLSFKNLSKSSFQAMAAGCLLLASKFSEVRPLTTEKLSLYTDSSVSSSELKEWEIKILNVLHWELTAVTTQDFLDHFMPNLSTKNQTTSRMRWHSEALAAAARAEYKFLLVQPSLLAAACLVAACQDLAQEDLLLGLLPASILAQAGQICVLVDHLAGLLPNSNVTSALSSCSSLSSSSSTTKLPPFHTVAKTAPYSYSQETSPYLHQQQYDYLSLASSAVGG